MTMPVRKERVYWTAPAAQLALAAILDGEAGDAALNKAFLAVWRKHELLRTAVRLRADGSLVFEPNESAAPKVRRENADWRAVIDREARLPFDLPKGEYARAFVMDTEDGARRLLLILHHIVTDGISALYLLRDVLRALSGESLGEPQPACLFDYDAHPKGKTGFFQKLMLSSVASKWARENRVYHYDECAQRQKEYWLDRHEHIEMDALTGKERDDLRRNCAVHEVTINTAIVTALSRALSGKGAIGVAVSLRAQEYDGLGNHATGISPAIPSMREETSFWLHAKSVHKAIYAHLQDDEKKTSLLRFMDALPPTLVDAACESALSSAGVGLPARMANMFGYTRPRTASFVSNLTRAPMPSDFGAIHVREIAFVPPIALNQARVVGAVTLGMRTVIVMRHAGGAAEAKVFDHMMEELRAASRYERNDGAQP